MTLNEGAICLFFPMFHCEFNAAELVWANAKQFIRNQGGINLKQLEKNIPLAFQQIKRETYFKIFQHAIKEMAVSYEQMVSVTKVDIKVYKQHSSLRGQVPWGHLLVLKNKEEEESLNEKSKK